MKLLVIIPAYNEQGNILNTLKDLKTHCPEADPLVINDCSADDTLAILRKNGIPHLNLPVNLGIGGAVQAGYLYAKENGYDIAVQFDGDGQHRADCIRALIQPVLEGRADMAVGSRFLRDSAADSFKSSAARRTGGHRHNGAGCHQRLPSGQPGPHRLLRGALRPGLSGAGGHRHGGEQSLPGGGGSGRHE